MKKLIFILLISNFCFSQEPTIPTNYIGMWTNAGGTDTIVIRENDIAWTSYYIDFMPFVSNIDFVYHNELNYFSFGARPTDFIISLEKISRNKIMFMAFTREGYIRSEGIYLRADRRQ